MIVLDKQSIFVYIIGTINKKGMFMRSGTKKFLIFGAASVAAIALLLLSAKQCCNKRVAETEQNLKRAETEADAAIAIAHKNEIDLIAARDSLADSMHAVDSLANEAALRDTTIAHLRDSLNACQNRRCGVKKSARKPGRKPAKSATGASVTASTVVAAPKDTTVNASVPAVAGANAVAIGGGAHDNTVNINNGTINNYYGVVDTVRNAKKIVTYTVDKCYTGRVVRCK